MKYWLLAIGTVALSWAAFRLGVEHSEWWYENANRWENAADRAWALFLSRLGLHRLKDLKRDQEAVRHEMREKYTPLVNGLGAANSKLSREISLLRTEYYEFQARVNRLGEKKAKQEPPKP